MSSGDGNIHIGTIGMGIPVIYREVVAKILSSHLAVESTFAKHIEENQLADKDSFSARLHVVAEHVPVLASDWVFKACRALNQVRNRCLHINDKEYQALEIRLQESLDVFVQLVKDNNKRLDQEVTDFEWASYMIFQRLYELLDLKYDPLELGRFAVLPAGLSQYFEVR